MTYNAIVRRMLLERIYDKMTDEEKRLFILTTMQDRRSEELLQAIQTNRQHLEHLVEKAEKNRWYTAFGSDVAANVTTTAAFWLLGRLFKK